MTHNLTKTNRISLVLPMELIQPIFNEDVPELLTNMVTMAEAANESEEEASGPVDLYPIYQGDLSYSVLARGPHLLDEGKQSYEWAGGEGKLFMTETLASGTVVNETFREILRNAGSIVFLSTTIEDWHAPGSFQAKAVVVKF